MAFSNLHNRISLNFLVILKYIYTVLTDRDSINFHTDCMKMPLSAITK